ncbi:methyltransferase domain-containing protein [Micromonospora sp. NPDC023956]|uniref:class I SAM-dependent DNA methyltransferase n=1 Tax=Micromonospora sp. NPDC023956 TaxID=3155722 RepID=UPI0033C58D24
MTDHHLDSVRVLYDTVAESYHDLVPPRFATDAVGRGMLTALAELVLADGGLPVADLGCGPGHVTGHLAALGLSVTGIDLSPAMVAIARRSHPALRFEVGSMTDLPLPDARLGGIVAWWSIVHTPPQVLPTVVAEFHRTLAPGGHLLLGFHAGDELVRRDHAYGHPVTVESYRHPPERVAGLLERAGFTVTARLVSGETGVPQACLLARRPVAD